jgi:hypothetical protein
MSKGDAPEHSLVAAVDEVAASGRAAERRAAAALAWARQARDEVEAIHRRALQRRPWHGRGAGSSPGA